MNVYFIRNLEILVACKLHDLQDLLTPVISVTAAVNIKIIIIKELCIDNVAI